MRKILLSLLIGFIYLGVNTCCSVVMPLAMAGMEEMNMPCCPDTEDTESLEHDVKTPEQMQCKGNTQIEATLHSATSQEENIKLFSAAKYSITAIDNLYSDEGRGYLSSRPPPEIYQFSFAQTHKMSVVLLI